MALEKCLSPLFSNRLFLIMMTNLPTWFKYFYNVMKTISIIFIWVWVKLIIGMVFYTYDFRGIVNQDLTLDFMLDLGRSVGSFFDKVAVGRDGRLHSEMLKSALIAGLLSVGCQVIDAGVTTTPTMALLAKTEKCVAGNVTASHNPPEWGGLKLFRQAGCGFMPEDYRRIMKRVKTEDFKVMFPATPPPLIRVDGIKRHINQLMALFQEFHVRVVVDPGGGVGTLILPSLLSALGCKVVTLNSRLNGTFGQRGAEPVAEVLRDLSKAVVDHRADVGFALDGDADRIVVVDEQGHIISGDLLLTLFASQYGQVVVPYNATSAIEEVCPRVIRTRVGDVFVSDAILRHKIPFGGEPSGHLTFADYLIYSDSAYTACKIIQLIEREGRLSQLLERFPRYHKRSTSLPCDRPDLVIQKVKAHLSDWADIGDGVRQVLRHGWIMIRKSQTEPKIRITAEAADVKTVDELLATYKRLVLRCAR
jgi:phosphomannomutase